MKDFFKRAGSIAKNFFKFEAKVGWGEVLGLCAVILTLHKDFREDKSTAPNVTVTQEKSTVELKCDRESGQLQVQALLRFRLANNGGKETYLVGLHQRRKGSPVLGVSKAPRPIPARAVLYAPREIGASDNISGPSYIENLEQIYFLNFPETETNPLDARISGDLQVGKPVLLDLGFKADHNQGGLQINRFTLNLELEYGDKKERIPFQVGITTPGIRGQQTCP